MRLVINFYFGYFVMNFVDLLVTLMPNRYYLYQENSKQNELIINYIKKFKVFIYLNFNKKSYYFYKL